MYELKFSNYSFKPSFLHCSQLRNHTGGFVVLLLAISLSGWRIVTIKGSFMSCSMSCDGYGSIYLLAFPHSVSSLSSHLSPLYPYAGTRRDGLDGKLKQSLDPGTAQAGKQSRHTALLIYLDSLPANSLLF